MKQTCPQRNLLIDVLQEILGTLPNISIHDVLWQLYRHIELVQAATFLGTTTGQLAQLRTHGGGPKFIKRGRNFVRYRLNRSHRVAGLSPGREHFASTASRKCREIAALKITLICI
jgi:hypothetical protein